VGLGALTSVAASALMRAHFAAMRHAATDQQHAAEALRLSEERFRRLADATMEGIIIHDQGRIVEVNHATELLFGYRAEELVGTSVLELAAPESRPTVVEHGMAGSQEPYEMVALRADGSRLHIEVLGRPMPRAGGTVRVAAVRDVSERRQAEAAVRESEARYRHLVEQAADGIFLADERGHICEVNSSGCALLGYSAEELLHYRLTDLIAPDDLAQRPVRSPLESGEVIRGHRRMQRKDGTEIDVDVCVSRLADGLMLGMVRDITEQKRAAAALRESEERYRLLVEASPLPIGVHSQGRIVYMNAAALRMSGATHPEQVIGRSMLDFVHPDFRAMVVERARRALAEGVGAPPAEEKFLRLDGQVLDVEMASMPVRYEGRPAVQVVMHDITERKRAEAALRHQALHDTLTGLANRALLDERLHQALETGRTTAAAAGLLVIDLDRFKEVNDSLGHRFGDAVLKQVAARWQQALAEARPSGGESPTLARLSGDEFAVLLAEAHGGDGLEGRVRARVAEAAAEFGFPLSVSVGLAGCEPGERCELAELFERADQAMYEEKAAKRRNEPHRGG
jgi:diguanylate cyclase (GGDEF)-like protein/PAS domain S-box-containing protein